MSVYIRRRDTKSGRRFDVAYRLGRYESVKHAGTFKSEREARLRKRKVEDWIAAAKDPTVELARYIDSGLSVAQLAQQWLVTKRRVKPGTLTEYERRVRTIADAFPKRAGSLTVSDVDSWVTGLSERFSPRTVRAHVITLRAILDHLDGPNVARDRRIELPVPNHRVLQPPDADVTLAVLARVSDRSRQVMVLMEQCGLRVSEACVVQPEHLDGRRLLVPVTKTGRPRWVPVPPWLAGRLDPPWHTNRQTVHNALKRACRMADVEPFGPHMLRHRRASLWHGQGVTPVEAAGRLGHSVDTYLRVYTHVLPTEEIPAHRLADLLR